MSETVDSSAAAKAAGSRQDRFLKSLYRRSLRLGIVAVFVTAGIGLAWFSPQSILLMREWVWDGMVRVKPRTYDPDLKVRIVDIDEASLAAHGQWPWPRARIARLVDALHGYGARAVGFDIIFAEPDRTSLSRVFDALRHDVPGYEPPLDQETLARQPDNDAILANAMTNIPVVLALSVEQEASASKAKRLENLPRVTFERRKDQRYLPRFPSAVAALPVLQQSAAANASIDPRVDTDGITRRAPLLFKIGKRTAPAFSLALVQAATGGPLSASTQRPGLGSISVGDHRIPTDRYGQMRLYDSGSRPDRYVSAADVLAGSVDDARLKDAIVIVGTGAEGLHDLRLTPLDQWIPGMETHAQFVEQILSGSYLSRPEWGSATEASATAVIGILLLLSVYFGWAKLPPWLIAAIAAVTFAAVSWVAFGKFRILLDPVVPAAALLSAAALDRFLLVLELRRERSAVRSAFARYLAPAVVEQLAENPDRLRLGGERREMTFLFCDIRGFTAISERFRNDPEGLTGLINRFLTPMTDEIMNRQGTIDKYMGDCIMAFWNAPLDDTSHARHACQSALAMQESLKALNARIAAATESGSQPYALKAGIGLNTGYCIVGNMGSEQRFDYSVLGDDVNLASRLEGQSKTYGVDILIGESTHAGAPDFAALEVDLIAVKGREAAVRVYALLGDPAVKDGAAFRKLAAAQNRLLSAYRSRDWPTARELVGQCRSLCSTAWNLDALYDLYEERLALYETTPPPPDWDGIYVAESK